MTVFAVRYAYNDNAEHRLAVRPMHRAWLAERLAAGELLASGPFADEGAPGALLVFRAGSRDELDAIVGQDPFAGADVLAATDVREWEQVLGPWTA